MVSDSIGERGPVPHALLDLGRAGDHYTSQLSKTDNYNL